MILLVKQGKLLDESIQILGDIQTPENGLEWLKIITHCDNILKLFIYSLTKGNAKHDNISIRYNLNLKIVAIEVDIKDYMTFSNEARENLEEITRTQLIHLFGSGD